ncbi:hypothetical protein [Cobetia crustatorum]|uniref:Uncharacterized protein n=1 Tax=Cobetia crustatorum TaxID=553385 RepID=A0A558HDK5_9GAMM|nr:hypothetical protein [Cobetia crustatorum]TVU67215.1 hypothetical protein FQP86_17385 [Cobetia crustatorum]
MANPYKRLLALMPTTSRQVGEVLSISGSRVRVDLVGGGVRTCQGDAQVGGMVYVEGDQITGVAPSLPVVVVEV